MAKRYIAGYTNTSLHGFAYFALHFSSVTVYQKNLQVIVTEIYKVKNGIAPDMMKDIFELQNPSYSLRLSCSQFRREKT